jgi:hypothetical protein
LRGEIGECALTDEFEYLVIGAYHMDGQTSGPGLGPAGTAVEQFAFSLKSGDSVTSTEEEDDFSNVFFMSPATPLAMVSPLKAVRDTLSMFQMLKQLRLQEPHGRTSRSSKLPRRSR